jgi:plastocyanin
LVLALLAAVALAAVGCGGGGGKKEKTTAGGTPSKPAAGAVGVDLKEYSFTPSKVTVKRGQTIEARNVGSLSHNLTIERGPDPKKETKKLAGTPTFGPGSTEKVTVSLDPGKYALVCTVSGHRQLGMVGTLTVGG